MDFLSGIKKAYDSIESDINAAVSQTPTSDTGAASSDDGSAGRSIQSVSATKAEVTPSDGWETSWGDEEAVATRSTEQTPVSSTKTPEKPAKRGSVAAGAMALAEKRPSAAPHTPKAVAAAWSATPSLTPETSSAAMSSGSPGGLSGSAAKSSGRTPTQAAKTGSATPTPGKAGGLDTMSRDDLVKYLRRQAALLKTSKSNCEEMTKRCTDLEQENAGLKAKPAPPAKKPVDVEDMQAQLATVSSVRDSLAEQLTASMSQQDALQRQLKINSLEIEGIASSKSETQERLLSTEAERDKFRQAVQQLRKKMASGSAAKESSTAAAADEAAAAAAAVAAVAARAVELQSAREENGRVAEALVELRRSAEALRADLEARTGECARLAQTLAAANAQALRAEESRRGDARDTLARHAAALGELEAKSRAELEARAASSAEEAERRLQEHSAATQAMAREHSAALEALRGAHADRLRETDEAVARRLEEQESRLNGREQEAVKAVAAELASAKTEIEQLQSKNESLRLQHDASAHANLTAAQTAQKELETQREELETQREELETQREELETQRETQREELSTRLSLLADEKSALEASVERERSQLAAQHKLDVEGLQAERASLQAQLSQATALTQELQQSAAAAVAAAAVTAGAEEQLSELTSQHATLGADLEQARDRNTELQRELDEVRVSLAQWTEKPLASAADADADAVDGGVAAAVDHFVADELRREVSRLEAELVAVQSALSAETARQCAEVERLCAAHGAAVSELEGKLASSETQADGAAALAKQLEEQAAKASHVEEECQSLRQQLTEAQHAPPVEESAEYQDVAARLEEASGATSSLRDQLAALTSEAAQRSSDSLQLQSELAGAREESAGLATQLASLQRDTAEAALQAAQEASSAESAQVTELQSQLGTKQAELTKLQERSVKLKAALVKMKADATELKEAQSAAAAAASASAAAATAGAEEQLSELTSQHATLGADLEQARDRNAELHRELDEVRVSLAQWTEKPLASAAHADVVDGVVAAEVDHAVADELRREVSRLETELIAVQSALSAETARQCAEVERLCAAHGAAVSELEGKLASSEAQADGAAALATQLEEQAAKASHFEDECQSLRQQLTEAQHAPPVEESAEYQDVVARLEEASGATASLRDQLAAVTSEASQRSGDSLELQSELAAAREKSAGLATQLASLQRDTAEAALQAAQVASSAESAQVTELQSQLGTKQAELTKLQERSAKLKAALVKMKADATELKETNAALKTRASSVGESTAEDLKKLQHDVLAAQSSRGDSLLQLEEAEKKQGQAEEKLQRTLSEVDTIRGKLKASDQRCSELDSEAAEVRSQLDGILKERVQLKEHIVQLQSSVSSQDAALAEERKRVNEERALVSGLRQEADSLRAKYEDQARKRESVEKDLERVSKEASKSSLMNLELDDYERTITTLESRIQDQERKLAESNKVYEKQVSICDGYKKHIAAIEAQMTHAEERTNKIKHLLVKSKEKLGEAQKQISTLESGEKELRDQLENAAQSTESGKMEFSEMAAELVTLRQQVETVSEAHRRTEQLLQQRLAASLAELSTARNQLAVVQTDYETYKVRVHSVLKQQKSKPQAQEDASLKELCDQRADSVQQLSRQLSELTETLSTSVRDREALEDDLQQLNDRYSMLRAESKQQERDFRERLDKLQSQHSSSELERVETMRQLNSQSEALSSAFKEEKARLRDQHASEAAYLSDKNRTLQDQLSSVIGQLASAEESVAQLRARATSEHADVMIGGGKAQHRAIVKPLQLRAASTDVERVEEVKLNSPPPETPAGGSAVANSFAQLLNSPGMLADDQVSTAGSEASTRAAASLKKQVQHVTELLSESEASAELLTQQVAILKEEIRRLERNEARREEVANLEYLKNIILKFLNADAKGQKALIPILDTLLKLSPQEKLFVEQAAAGRAPAVPNLIPDSEAARRAANAAYSNVSSYMRSWTGY